MIRTHTEYAAAMREISKRLMRDSKQSLADRLALELVTKIIETDYASVYNPIIAAERVKIDEADIKAEHHHEASRKSSLQALEFNWQVLRAEQVKGEKFSATQSNRRIGKTKLSDSQKKAVQREYEAANTIYGMIKSLARKYEVSEDTISRVVS